MLSSLHIENIAVIKELNLDFTKGLTVLTGETGAGKSIIIGSLRLLLGARSDKDSIRSGEKEAYVEGFFQNIKEKKLEALEEIGVTPDENRELLLSRRISTDGKNICKVNNRTVPLALLKEIGKILIAIHGQKDTQILQNEDTPLLLLDRYGNLEEETAQYQKFYLHSVKLKTKLTELLKEQSSKEKTVAECRNAIEKINDVHLKIGEDLDLERKKEEIRNFQKTFKQSRTVYRSLFQNEKGVSCKELLKVALNAIGQLEYDSNKKEEMIRRLTFCQMEVEEIAKEIYAPMEMYGENPEEELSLIDDRLDALKKLFKNYGSSVEEVLRYKEECEEKLLSLSSFESDLKNVKNALEVTITEARNKAKLLTKHRLEAAAELEKAINEQLRYLDLEKVLFKVDIEEEFSKDGIPKLSSTGCGKVRFLISTNPGEEPKPVSNIASGGELSRIMLAFKVALTDKEDTETLVFDEIDTGISGKTSQKIGMKLQELSKYSQIFCITHSAQVASNGHTHLRIYKEEVEGRNRTMVQKLDTEERILELSRILGGIQITDTIKKSAEELLNSSKEHCII